MKTLLIDNYDSYSHLLAYYIWRVTNQKPILIKNDEFSLKEISCLEFDKIIISPGPGHPDQKKDFGICKDLILQFKKKKPILGVCLGHQGIGSIYGFSIVKTTPMHGKISWIEHFGSELFQDIPKKFEAMRYHSLLLEEKSKANQIEIIAKEASQNLIMGIKIKNTQVYGVQFHPESIGTPFGMKIIENFINLNKFQHPPKPIIDLHNKQIAQNFTTLEKQKNKAIKTRNKNFYFENLHSNLTEEEIFYKIYAKKKYAIWLDSSLKNENGKISIMASSCSLLYSKKNKIYFKNLKKGKKKQINSSPFLFLKKDLKKNKLKNTLYPYDFMGGWLGYFSYEAKYWLGMKTNSKKRNPALPEIFMMKVKHFLLFDHENQTNFLASFSSKRAHIKFKEKVNKKLEKKNKKYQKISLDYLDQISDKKKEEIKVKSFFNEKSYIKKIKKITKKLKNGETYEICLTNEFLTSLKINNFSLYQILRLTNPAPFSSYMKFGKNCIFSSSPEQFIKLSSDGLISSEPIKGTRKNTSNHQKNEKIASELLHCPKDRSELLMITDLIRNDLSRVSKKNSLEVEKLFKISHYATLIQLSSVITAKIEENYDSIDLFMNLFPGGSITGAPKWRSMEIIDQLEKRKRGVYTGSIGYFSYSGAMDFSIAIRTIEKKNSSISFGAGGAITIDSNSREEYKEVQTKTYALLRALSLARLLKKNKF